MMNKKTQLLRWLIASAVLVSGISLFAYIHTLRGELNAAQFGLSSRAAAIKILETDRDKRRDPRYSSILERQLDTDLSPMMTLRSASDIQARRRQLATLIWGSSGLSRSAMPAQAE